MGPMGNYMTLLQLARGRGGYGGPQGYGGYGMPRSPMGYGPYGGPQQQGYGAPQQGQPPGWLQNLSASPAMQGLRDRYAGMGPQGSSWEQAPPETSGMRPISAEGMGGAADANMQALQAAYGAMGQGAPAAAPDQSSGMQPISAAGMQGAIGNMNTAQAPGSFMRPIDASGMAGAAGAMQAAYGGYPGMNMAYNPMGLRGRRRFY